MGRIQSSVRVDEVVSQAGSEKNKLWQRRAERNSSACPRWQPKVKVHKSSRVKDLKMQVVFHSEPNKGLFVPQNPDLGRAVYTPAMFFIE
jgi:hypothetical protein